ncbi:hypothetical protein pb186bvf_008094 [Paramecium bursaria]
MKDDNSAQYVYYNLKQSPYKYKRAYGDQIEIGQLRKVGSVNSKDFMVVLRYLPINMNDFDLIPDARKEEPFEYKGYKYGIIKVSNLEQAELLKQTLVKQFISKKYDGIKIQIYNDSNPILRKKKIYTQFYQDKLPNPEQKLQQIIGLRKEEPRIKIRAPEIRLEEIRRPKISAPQIIAPQISAPFISAPLLNPEPVRFKLIEAEVQGRRSEKVIQTKKNINV